MFVVALGLHISKSLSGQFNVSELIAQTVFPYDPGISTDNWRNGYAMQNIEEQRVHKLDRKGFEQELIKLNMVYDIKTINESKDYLYFQIKQGGINYCILYGMKSGKVKKFKTWNNDINFFGFSIPAATYGNEFVSVVDAYIIEILQNQFKNSRSVEEYQNYLNGLDSFSKDVLFNIQSSDNPILCFYTFNV